ncbi:MAG: DNA repair protein RecN [Tissierellales bacterium]|nr:DNA repair protein RecN [Tissierellales bacterium]
MLRRLHIENYAIIDKLTIDFEDGFNVLTGETGSGKSIIIEALGVVLGGRSNRDMIRTGKESAYIEATFNSNSFINNKLEDIGIQRDDLLIISKEIYTNQPSIARINNKVVTNSVLNDITSSLVDIFGQHEHQSLLEVKNHISILDSFLEDSQRDILLEINNLYDEYIFLKKKKKEIETNSQQRERELDLIKYQIEEIDSLELSTSDEKIEQEFKKLNNLEEIIKLGNRSLEFIKGESFEQNAMDLIDKSVSLLKDLGKLDENFHSFYDQLLNFRYELNEIYTSILDYLNSLYYDEEKLVFLRDRLNSINMLKKKYGNTIEDILSFRKELDLRINFLMNLEYEQKSIDDKLNEIEKKLLNKSNILTEFRKSVAKELEKSIKNQLIDLNMKNIEFIIGFNKKDNITRNGVDDVEFLISTNAGEKLKPLSKIISGGEMSRIMLAIKSIFAQKDNIPVLIFDEIDTGISGRTAQLVGEKIKQISTNRQVISISHLPQIVALADVQFSIDKSSNDNTTIAKVTKLDFDERVKELARMLGGASITDTTLKHAREMLEMT